MKKGSYAVVEYAVLLVIVCAALTGAMFYLKQGICGRWRDVADSFGGGKQYEPGVTVCTQDGIRLRNCRPLPF